MEKPLHEKEDDLNFYSFCFLVESLWSYEYCFYGQKLVVKIKGRIV